MQQDAHEHDSPPHNRRRFPPILATLLGLLLRLILWLIEHRDGC